MKLLRISCYKRRAEGAHGYEAIILMTLVLLTLSLVIPSDSSAQILGTKHFWSDSIKVTTTAIDCTFTQRWEYLEFWADSCDIRVKIGAPDTIGFTNRKSVKIEEHVVSKLGPATPVKRMLIKAAVDSGTIYFWGYKTIRQR